VPCPARKPGKPGRTHPALQASAAGPSNGSRPLLSRLQILPDGVGRVPNRLDRRTQLIRGAAQAVGPVTAFMLLLEGNQLAVGAGLLAITRVSSDVNAPSFRSLAQAADRQARDRLAANAAADGTLEHRQRSAQVAANASSMHPTSFPNRLRIS